MRFINHVRNVMSFNEQTYGEVVDTQKMYSLISDYISNSSGYRFYDFGSGFGKIVEEYANKFKESQGIEINKERHMVAKKNNKHASASFIHGNFFHTDIQSSCVVFCNNLCLGIGTLKRLSMKFNNELNPGDLLLVTKPMPWLSKQYRICCKINCSWGESEIYLYTI